MVRLIRKVTRLSVQMAAIIPVACFVTALAQESDEARQNLQRSEMRVFSSELTETHSEGLAAGDALSGRIAKLKSAKRDALRLRFEAVKRSFDVGVRGYGMAEVAQARSAWIDAELEMSTNRAQRVKWLRELVDNAVDMEEIVLAMADANAVGGDHASVAAAHAARFDAELRLAQELAVPAKAK
jgi:hypothetical protein